MDLIHALDATNMTWWYVAAGIAVVAAALITGLVAREGGLGFLVGALFGLIVAAFICTAGAAVVRDAQADVIADYLREERHLIPADPVDVLRDDRAIARVITPDGDVKWADITWLRPDDVRAGDSDVPDYDPVTVGLSDTKPPTKN